MEIWTDQGKYHKFFIVEEAKEIILDLGNYEY